MMNIIIIIFVMDSNYIYFEDKFEKCIALSKLRIIEIIFAHIQCRHCLLIAKPLIIIHNYYS